MFQLFLYDIYFHPCHNYSAVLNNLRFYLSYLISIDLIEQESD